MLSQIFKGIRRTKTSLFKEVTAEEKNKYVWFVRNDESDISDSASIYIGDVKYGETNTENSGNTQDVKQIIKLSGFERDESTGDLKIPDALSGVTSLIQWMEENNYEALTAEEINSLFS